MRTLLFISSVLLIAAGCDDTQRTWSSDPKDAQDPSGAPTLMSLGDEDVTDTIAYAGVEIDQWRAAGVEMMVAALKKELTAYDISGLDRINDGYIGTKLRSYTVSGSTTQGLGQRRYALDASEIEKHFECPVLAPENNEGTKCDDLVDAVLVKVKDEIEQNQGQVESEIKQDYADLPDLSSKFIASWANAAQKYGAGVAAIYAKQELQAAAQCDNKENASIVAFSLGRQQGVSIVEAYRVWAIEQVKSCVINTDIIAEQVRQMSINDIEKFMTENKVCEDADLSNLNTALKEAEVKRKEGIRQGIDERVEILRQELFEARRTTNCCGWENAAVEPVNPEPELPPATCDVDADCDLVPLREGKWRVVKNNCVCCRRRRATSLIACKGPTNPPLYCGENRDGSFYCQCESIPLGSPIVIDLDDDGLSLSSELVSFDLLAAGDKQRCTWVGPREGIVALDHDGDGKITSSRELFGNQTRCGDRLCGDGVAALKQWDDPARGGNGDGLIDRRDMVFSQLLIWFDRNHDGLSQPQELHPLEDVDVQSFNLDATYDVERRAAGSITSQLDVLTGDGFRQAFDVWFKVKVTPAELAHLLPY